MARQKRPRRAETEPTSHVEPPPAVARSEPRQPKVQFSADGMIEEAPASSWGRTHLAEPSDSRSLAELAASVMSAEQLESPEAPPDAIVTRDRPMAYAREAEPVVVKAADEERPKSSHRRGAGALVLLLVVLGAMSVAWLHSTVGDSASESTQDGQIVAAPADAGSSGGDASAPAAGGGAPQEAAAAVPIGPTPEPAPEQAAPAAPPAAQPAPAAAPEPASVPPPPPPPLPPMIMHISDLDGAVRGGKVFVQIFVRDSTQNPVEGAVVYLSWEGAAGPSSCITAAGGSCTVHTSNLSSPARVTLTVTGVTVAGGTYDAGVNQDPDGDSNGTSITVTA